MKFKIILIALFCLKTMLLFSQNSTETGKIVDSLFQQGLTLFRQGENAESVEILLKAQSMVSLSTHTDSVAWGNILHYLGANYISLARRDEAYQTLHQALIIRQLSLGQNHPECSKTHNNLAVLCREMDKLEEAEEHILKALEIKSVNPGKDQGLEYSTSQAQLALILLEKGQYERSDSVAQDYVKRRKRLGEKNKFIYATALNLWAGVKTRKYELESAKALYDEALDIAKAEKGENSVEYLSVDLNIGQVYAKLGLYAEAEKRQRACLKLAESIKGKHSEAYAVAMANLGFILIHQGRMREALPVLEEAKMWNEAWYGSTHTETLRVVGNLSVAYYYLGDLQRATELSAFVIDVIEKSGRRDEEYFNAVNNYGRLLIAAQHYDLAKDILLKLEKEYSQTAPIKLAGLHINLGQVYMYSGEMELAEQRLKQGLHLLNDNKSISTIYNLSIFSDLVRLYYLKNDTLSALHYAREGLDYLESRLPSDIAYLTESQLYDVAVFAFSRNSDFFEVASSWNNSELNGICFDYQLFVKNYILDFAIALRKNFDAREKMHPAQQLEWKIAQRHLTDELTRTNPDKSRIESLRSQIDTLEKHMIQIVAPPPVINWKQVRAALKPGEACLLWTRYRKTDGDFYYAVFVLTAQNSAPVLVPIGAEKEFEIMLKQDSFYLSKYYGKGGAPDLYRYLMAPLASYLDGVTTIWCMPAGLLYYVNFSAINIEPGKITGNIFHFRVMDNNTKRIIERPVENYYAPKTALIMGNINYGPVTLSVDSPTEKGSIFTKGWKKIEHSQPEIQSAERLLRASGTRVSVFTDTLANKAQAYQSFSSGQTWDCIHFSSHGLYWPPSTVQDPLSTGSNWLPLWRENPLEHVGIALANANKPEGGILTGLEISQMDLSRNYLTIVSTCGSATGDMDAYEGVWGLNRAFRLAGSRQVMLTLWETRDDATSFFMNAFYRNWLSLKLSVPAAFEAAQRETQTYNPDPSYWAGFILWE